MTPGSPRRTAAALAVLAIVALALGAGVLGLGALRAANTAGERSSAPSSSPAAPEPAPSTGTPSTGAPVALPSRPAASTAAPSTSGELGADDLPAQLPGGYQPTAVAGGAEAGFVGNGTHVRAKDLATVLDPLRVLRGADVFPRDLVVTEAVQGTYRQPQTGQVANVLLLTLDSPDQAARVARDSAGCATDAGRLEVERDGRRVRLTAFG
ncbi:hypothetical protein [Nocardioides daeguensis]|uniref:Sortase n=1 Tax=Nocardioides daeguensis TaxID=908359 RepID=A0ABP6V7U0_9ACTN|nr:hypothetical protein [Nocardioides daeguensis]MBV6726442.1 hypothetical protein [Nocardioides daeguensis]MCR1772285.1 hypothetical protein [Nocardioides daeguensis]